MHDSTQVLERLNRSDQNRSDQILSNAIGEIKVGITGLEAAP